MTRFIAICLGLVMLAACQPATTGPRLPMTCNDSYQSIVGSNIGAVTLPRGLPHRIISPGQPYTEDYNPDRVNLFVDEKGWIARVTCG